MGDRSDPHSAERRNSLGASLASRSWDVRPEGGGVTVTLVGDWIASAEPGVEPGSAKQILDTAGHAATGHRIAFNSQQLGKWDSTLLLFFASLGREACLATRKSTPCS
jgi:hypothetical protein